MKVAAIVGLAGSGKSEVAAILEERGFFRVRFGDLTDREIERRGLELTPENERRVRELLRAEHGMAAYAELNIPRIDSALPKTNVVVDGLYSWEEYTLLKARYREDFSMLAVWASPKTRYQRLAERRVRSLTPEEAFARDAAEIENINKGGPIAMADFTIINESSLADLRRETERIIEALQ